jgi:hypothetical protein
MAEECRRRKPRRHWLGQLEPHLVVVDARTDGHVVDDLL